MKTDLLKIGELGTEVRLWRDHLAARNLSPKTIKAYMEAGTQLEAFLVAKGMPSQVAAIRREHVEAFIVDVLDRTSASTAATRFRALQQLFKYLAEEGVIQASPMARMKPPKLDEAPVPVIPEADLRKLLKACSGRSFDERRDTALIMLFIDTGARLGEMVGLRLEEVDLERKRLRVMGKGRRARDVPFGANASRSLIRYLRERSRHPNSDLPWLWLGLRGRLTDSGVVQILRRRCRHAGMPAVHPHQFRHTFAHLWLSQGNTEHDLATIAGWASLQMIGRYAKSAATERAHAAHRRFSPADHL